MTITAPEAASIREPRAKRLHVWLSVGLYAFFTIFLLWPILQVVAGGFLRSDLHPTPNFVALVFQDPVLRHGLLNATIIAVLVTLLSLLIAVPLAVLGVRYDFPGRRMLSGLLLVPLVLPPFVGAIGIRLILGRFGPATQVFGSPALGIDWLGKYRLAGIVLVEALHLYPVLLLNLQAALANVDPAMEQAAASRGRGAGRCSARSRCRWCGRACSPGRRWC